jgi:hypothetical protein
MKEGFENQTTVFFQFDVSRLSLWCNHNDILLSSLSSFRNCVLDRGRHQVLIFSHASLRVCLFVCTLFLLPAVVIVRVPISWWRKVLRTKIWSSSSLMCRGCLLDVIPIIFFCRVYLLSVILVVCRFWFQSIECQDLLVNFCDVSAACCCDSKSSSFMMKEDSENQNYGFVTAWCVEVCFLM